MKTVEVNPVARMGAGPGYEAGRRVPPTASYMDRSPEIDHSPADPLTGVTVRGAFYVHRQTSFVPRTPGDGRR